MSGLAEYRVGTKSGEISVWDSRGAGPTALFIHGNSACKEIFQKQFQSSLGRNFRLIAIDLPGHGKSDRADNPETTYSLPGYADVAVEVLNQLGIEKVTIVGWSLGGHIAIDMLKRWPGIQGIFITGTPPIPLTPEGFQKGFRPFPCLHLLGQEKFSKEEAEIFVSQGGIKTQDAPFLLEATLKADGAARAHLIASMQKGIGGNQKHIVESAEKPVAIVAGIDDTGINNDYLEKEVNANNLWKSRVHFIQGGHGVFWENPQKFNEILSDFLRDVNVSREVQKPKAWSYATPSLVCAFAVAILAGLFHQTFIAFNPRT